MPNSLLLRLAAVQWTASQRQIVAEYADRRSAQRMQSMAIMTRLMGLLVR